MTIQLLPSSAPMPLEFRLYEAIDKPLAATFLPRAFAVSDLSGNHGWKTQLHAAERLKGILNGFFKFTLGGIVSKVPRGDRNQKCFLISLW